MALESVGFLASHYCDTPALVGVGIDDNRFIAKVLPGTVLRDRTLKNAMYVVGEDRAVRNLAHEFAHGDAGELAPRCRTHDAGAAGGVVRGTYAARGSTGYVGPSLMITRALSNDPLGAVCARLRVAWARQGARVPQGRGGRVLARGAGGGGAASRATSCPLFRSRPRRARPARAPRRRWAGSSCPTRTATPSRSRRCSTRRPCGSRRSRRLVGPAADSARDVCLAAAKRVFPDDFDRIAFNALVTPALYDRCEQLSGSVREAAAVTLSQDLIGGIFADYTDRSAA